MNKTYSLKTRWVALLLALVLIVGLLPGPSVSAENQASDRFGFNNKEIPTQIYLREGLTVDFSASGGPGNGAVTYEVVTGQDIATVDANGILTITGVGTIKVKASKAADGDVRKVSINRSIEVLAPAQYGTVTPLTGGTVTGNGEAETALTITEATLSWMEAGGERTSNGWWVGFQLNAPEGILESQLEQTKVVCDGNEETVTWKDTKGVFYIQKWFSITPEDLYHWIALGESMTHTYQISWAMEGEVVEQTVTFTLVPSDMIKLVGGDQENFRFETANPGIKWANETYQNVAVGGIGAVTYKLVDANGKAVDETELAIIAADGTVTFKAAGTVKVQATSAGDANYNSKTIYYEVTAKKATEKLTFEQVGTVTVGFHVGTVQNIATSTVDGTVTYEIVEQDQQVAKIDPATGVVTLLGVGEVTVKATKTGNPLYEDATATYKLIVREGEQEIAFVNCPESVIWTDALQTLPGLSGTETNGEITYTITAGKDVAELVEQEDGTLALKLLKAGTFTLKATRAGNGQYKTASVDAVIVVLHAQQDAVVFEQPEVELVYDADNNTYTQLATGGSSTGDTEYKIISKKTLEGEKDVEIATITAAGEVTILRSGIVTIQATKLGDACYEAATATYTLTIQRAPQTIAFGAARYNCYYGEPSFTQTIANAGLGTGKITYSIAENNLGASIDAETGKITFAQGTEHVGQVVVTAVKAQDERYLSTSTTYTLKISYLAGFSVPAPILEGEKYGDWYTGTVTIRAPEGYQISDSNLLDAEWGESVKHTAEGINRHTVYLRNIETQAITASITIMDIKVDNTAPTGLKVDDNTTIWAEIGEKLFGFAPETVTVTLSAQDDLSGIAYFEYTTDGETFIKVDASEISGGSYSFPIDPEYRNVVSFRATDVVGKTSELVNGRTLVVDSINTNITVTHEEGTAKQIGDILYTDNEGFALNITVTDENYDLRENDPVVTVNGVVADEQWTHTDEMSTIVVPLTETGDYEVQVSFESERIVSAETVTVQVNVDHVNPVITLFSKGHEVTDTHEYHGAENTIVVQVADHNFCPDEVEVIITAKDINGNEISVTAPDLTAWEKWTCVEENEETDLEVWQAEIPFHVDANYTVQVKGTDILGHAGESAVKSFTVDGTNPDSLNVIYDKDEGVLKNFLENIFFYHDEPKVTLVAHDLTAGVEFFEITAKRNGFAGATTVELPKATINTKGEVVEGTAGFLKDITVEEKDGTVEISFRIPAQYRGELVFKAIDRSGNKTASYDDSYQVVVDTIAPNRTITFEPVKVYSAKDMTEVEAFAEGQDVVMYYNTDAVATIRVEEANFYGEDVVIRVNGTEVQPDQGWKKVTDDNGNSTGVWEATVTITAEGDHVITVDYTDRSSNVMTHYESQRIVIDKTAPVIDVVYSNVDVKNTIGDRDYFDAVQNATITIREHNFRADDVVVKVTADNVLGAAVLKLNENGVVESYAVQGADRKGWTAFEEGTWRREDDTYVLTLSYAVDANYTFDVEYQDMATNAAADYEPDAFTVDKTAPAELEVYYSTSLLEQIIESVTFGYYNAQMTVTITASDETSGIYHFDYSYINSDSVSKVNAELLNQAIAAADITYDGMTATASFTIPKLVLGNDNQFNGTVEFTAYDRSENSTLEQDETRIIVDNISPTATVSYGPAVQEVNGVSYHNEAINASIVINEANFNAGDVKVTVTKDGAEYPVRVNWYNNSVDIHTGTFTLAEDGDYLVFIEYTDKSGNKMNSYASNQLTVDTTFPVITASGIQMNSANKDEKYGFTVTISDINLDVASMKPILTAVVKGEDGKYTTQEIALGDAQTVTAGESYQFTVENLELDALYTLICTAQDMSGNTMKQIVLDDNKTYETVQFSINRSGSAFGFGDTFVEELVSQYYIYSVEQDVVIVEVNVDPIENYAVKLNGVELTEGEDYTTDQTSNAGEWSKRTYVINKSLFAEEGEYSIIIASTDKASTTAYSDVKNLSVSFVVDQTAPVITVTGLANNGRYQTEEQTVTLIPSDEGGRLNSLKVVVLDSDGNPKTDDDGNDISLRFEMSGDELLAHLEANDGKITFTVPSGLNNQVQIICNDCAVNAEGSTNEYNETFTKVTVTTNGMLIFYANTPVFYGSVGGILALIAAIIAMIVRKKKGAKA